MKILKKSLTLFVFNALQFQAHCLEPIVVELNPMLMINQGLGINLEIGLIKNISSGIALELFKQKLYANNSVNAARTIYNGSYFLRYYFFSNKMAGPFLSGKMNYTQSEINISDTDFTISSNKQYVSALLAFGYRFISDFGLTFSVFIGGGIKNKTNYIDKNNLPLAKSTNADWNNAIDELNKQESKLQPDFGITIGYVF